MEKEKGKAKSWLLTNIPADIVEIVRGHQLTKIKDCNCRYGVGQAIYHLLRKAYGHNKSVPLQDGANTPPSTVPNV